MTTPERAARKEICRTYDPLAVCCGLHEAGPFGPAQCDGTYRHTRAFSAPGRARRGHRPLHRTARRAGRPLRW